MVEAFGKHGRHIVDVRLIVHKNKNIGYVDFNTSEHKDEAYEALHTTPIFIDDKRILIQHCDSQRQKTKKLLQVVFLKNVSFKVT